MSISESTKSLTSLKLTPSNSVIALSGHARNFWRSVSLRPHLQPITADLSFRVGGCADVLKKAEGLGLRIIQHFLFQGLNQKPPN